MISRPLGRAISTQFPLKVLHELLRHVEACAASSFVCSPALTTATSHRSRNLATQRNSTRALLYKVGLDSQYATAMVLPQGQRLTTLRRIWARVGYAVVIKPLEA
jgi:hypothetical protein